MSNDFSRIRFDVTEDQFGVLLQQGRPLAESDWNALVAQITRRTHVGSLDTFGPAIVPEQTPEGFHIIPGGGNFTIGAGRIYVDGLLAENHGSGPLHWDVHAACEVGSNPISYDSQPYLPNALALPAAGSYIAYVDVWQREVGALQDESLVDIAIGVDTCARLQTVWQVRALAVADDTDCSTPLDTIPGWDDVTAPSSGRLTTAAGDVPGEPDPCLVPPLGGYKGGENQLYRVEVQKAGVPGTATFKWSRNNASLEARIQRIPDLGHLVVDSVGKDDVLRIQDGDWIEILDDVLELSGQPGVLRQVAPVNGVADATRIITLTQPLPFGMFAVDGAGNPTGNYHTRIRLWDQGGQVKKADGTVYADLDAAGSSGDIVIPADASQILLESGVLVSFGVAVAGGEFHSGDWWVFAARTADASLEILSTAPPRGIHHHYAKLAVVTPPAAADDCRIFWPPNTGCCTVVVKPGGSIQAAIDSLPPAGGCVCLKAGVHAINAPINIARSNVSLHGESPGTRVLGFRIDALLEIGVTALAQDIEIAMIDFEYTQPNPDARIVLLSQCQRVRIKNCGILYTAAENSLISGIFAVSTADVDLCGNRIENCYVGVYADGATRGLRVYDNRLQGPLTRNDAGEFPWVAMGVLLMPRTQAEIRGNTLTDYLMGIKVFLADAVILNNRILRRALPALLDGPQPPEKMMFAIDAAADNCSIRGNRLDLQAQTYGGIRVTGKRTDVADNELLSGYSTPSFSGPIGFFAGDYSGPPSGDGDSASVRSNRFIGLQVGARINAATGVCIRDNAFEGSNRAGIGIVLTACFGATVAGNTLRDLGVPLLLLKNARSRIENNRIDTSLIGTFALAESTLEYVGNRLEDASVLGVGVLGVGASNRFARNRIANCAYAAVGFASGIAILHPSLSAADVTIESCDVVGTGVAPDGSVTAAVPVLCITSFFAANVQVLNNRALYESRFQPKVGNDNRALLLIGVPATTTHPLAGPVVENAVGGALILGNVFEGNSSVTLVEVRRVPLNATVDLRFEKLTVSNNRCTHEAPNDDSVISVNLFGSHMIVSGNIVKTSGTITTSIGLGHRDRVVLMSNHTTRHYSAIGTTVPAVFQDFNVIL